ncbi:MAG: flippase-like domain-containing protein [Clostridiaceae bacterium]|nr:flippase-like domain-containing protein [Clostridiaceae bacterium]MBW4861043.1 flippase-like domain-containing protein [Clostridiaceae bacterium]MBW4867668.1 flippase-like domain-containing protein [Clostridiaceae bacterium]
MKKLINYIVLISLIVLTGWILIHNNDLSNFTQLMHGTNKVFLLLAFLSMILFWLSDAYIIHKMKKALNIEDNFKSSIKLSMIGEYYSAITPFATGGQPMQIYLLNNAGVQVGTASSLMVTKLLVYQIVVTLYSIFMFIIKFNFLLKEAKLSFPFVMIGCLFNFIVVLTILGLFYNEKLIRKILSKLLLFGNRLNLIKDIKKSEDKLNMNILDYKASIDSMKEDKKTTLILIITTFVQLTFYFSITYFVYLSVGLPKVRYLDIIALQSLHYMAVSLMPTPGTVGAAEGGFYILYSSIFPKSILTFAMVLWRFIDYYFGIIVGGVITLVDFIYRRNNKVTMSMKN